MKRLLLAFVCLLGFSLSAIFGVQDVDVATDEKPEIISPISTEDFA